MNSFPPYSADCRCIVLFCGLPASGKTTAAKQLIASEPDRWRRVNRDDLRLMLWNGPWSPVVADEKVVTEIAEAAVRSNLEAGFDVIVDNTNLKARDRKDFHLIAESVGNCIVVEKVFPCVVGHALGYNALRSGPSRVPDSVIIDKAKQFHVGKDGCFKNIKDSITEYKEPTIGTLIQDENLPPAVICDLDGTLCLIGERNRYDASRCEEDTVNQPVLDVLESLSESHLGDNVIFMSGRSDKYRPETDRWLQRHARSHRLYDYELFMRAEGDMRKDSIIKKELLEKHVLGKYWVRLVLDDRSSVVSMWRSLGLSCFQVAPGDF